MKQIPRLTKLIILKFPFAGDECRESSDCNIQQGLCCRLTRRQRMQPKKVYTHINFIAFRENITVGKYSHDNKY